MTQNKTRVNKRVVKRRVGVVMMAIAIIALSVFVSYIDTHYTREAVVIHTANNYYAVAVDEQGNEWEFCADDISVGQKISMTMYNNNSITIYDDEVVDIKVIAETF